MTTAGDRNQMDRRAARRVATICASLIALAMLTLSARAQQDPPPASRPATPAAAAPDPAPSKPAETPAPEPPDRDEPLFQALCAKCHPTDRIVAVRKSSDEWKETLDQMILKGAVLSDQDYETVLTYLVRNYDRVDINWVQPEELAIALGLKAEEADAIVQYRKEHGNFKDFDALARVPGIDVKKLEKKREIFRFY